MKWDKTGTVIEVWQCDQYVVKIDGSGRMSTRNRKFLRKYIPVMPSQPTVTIQMDLNHRKRSNPRSNNLPSALSNNPSLHFPHDPPPLPSVYNSHSTDYHERNNNVNPDQMHRKTYL